MKDIKDYGKASTEDLLDLLMVLGCERKDTIKLIAMDSKKSKEDSNHISFSSLLERRRIELDVKIAKVKAIIRRRTKEQ